MNFSVILKLFRYKQNNIKQNIYDIFSSKNDKIVDIFNKIVEQKINKSASMCKII